MPAGQFVQDGSPDSEYLPSAHAVQALLTVLPEAELVPAVQEAQTLESVKVFDVAPARAYLPAGQVKDKHAPPLPVE